MLLSLHSNLIYISEATLIKLSLKHFINGTVSYLVSQKKKINVNCKKFELRSVRSESIDLIPRRRCVTRKCAELKENDFQGNRNEVWEIVPRRTCGGGNSCLLIQSNANLLLKLDEEQSVAISEQWLYVDTTLGVLVFLFALQCFYNPIVWFLLFANSA